MELPPIERIEIDVNISQFKVPFIYEDDWGNESIQFKKDIISKEDLIRTLANEEAKKLVKVKSSDKAIAELKAKIALFEI